MSDADELLHQIKYAAAQQSDQHRPDVYGHVANYDPATHRVRLIIPSLTDGDGNYVPTSWMPLGTIMAGNAWGYQAAPMGGATAQNPTAGEKCKVTLLERNYGVTVCAEMAFDQVYVPPFTDLQPGEIAIQAQSKSFLRFHTNGQVEVNLPIGDLTATVAQGNCNVTAAAGNATVAAPGGKITLESPLTVVTGDLQLEGQTYGTGGAGSAIQGDLTVTGTLRGETDVSAGVITSLVNMTVSGVMPGGGSSGPPNPGT